MACAMAFAATLIAGSSRKSLAFLCEMRRDLTSCSSAASPAPSRRRNSSRSSDDTSSADCNRESTCFHRAASIARSATHVAVKPGASVPPIPHHSDRRYLEHFRRFLHAQASKEAQLNHPRLAHIHAGESLQGIVEHYQVFGSASANYRCVFQGNMLDPTSTFQVVMARMVN